MKKDYIHKQFWNYVLPSMFTMLLSGFYAIVDGLFVGNAVGDTALGAINLAYPIQVILNATAIGLGIGGSVVMSRSRGDGKEDKWTADRSIFVIGHHAIQGFIHLDLSFGQADILDT